MHQVIYLFTILHVTDVPLHHVETLHQFFYFKVTHVLNTYIQNTNLKKGNILM